MRPAVAGPAIAGAFPPVPGKGYFRSGILRIAAAAVACLAASAMAAKPLDYVCYSPYRDGQRPGGPEPSEAQIREDFALLAPLAKGIRTYTCSGIHAAIPALAREAGLEVQMGAWIGKDEAANLREVAALIQIARTGNPSLKGLIVGNEVLLREDVTRARLIEYLQRVRQAGVALPVTTADIYQRMADNSAELAPVLDYVLCHVHPFWENVAAEKAAEHVLQGWSSVKARYPGKTVLVGETGFPAAGQTRDAAVPSEAAQARFAGDLLVLGARNGMSIMFFEAFDEAWKGEEGPAGANWGLWRSDRTEKPAVAAIRGLGGVGLAPRAAGIRPVSAARPFAGLYRVADGNLLPSAGMRAGPLPTLRIDAAGRLRADAGTGTKPERR